MNLLEHYILSIESEQIVTNPYNRQKYYRVKAIVDCHGHYQNINRLFSIEEWEEAKKQGYFMA